MTVDRCPMTDEKRPGTAGISNFELRIANLCELRTATQHWTLDTQLSPLTTQHRRPMSYELSSLGGPVRTGMLGSKGQFLFLFKTHGENPIDAYRGLPS